jgi:hypothetical protein
VDDRAATSILDAAMAGYRAWQSGALSRGDGWVFLAEVEVFRRLCITTTRGDGTDANSEHLRAQSGRTQCRTHLLGVVAHRLLADGSRTMCVGYDSASHAAVSQKYSAVETGPAPQAIWLDVGELPLDYRRPPTI